MEAFDHIDTTLWFFVFSNNSVCVASRHNALIVREECHCWHVFGLTMLRGPVVMALRASVCCHHFLCIHLKVVSASYKLGSDRFAYFCHLFFFLPCNCRHRGSRGAHRKATSLNIAKLPCRSWIGLFRILARLFVVYTMDVLGVSLGLLVESTVRLAAVKPCTMMLLD